VLRRGSPLRRRLLRLYAALLGRFGPQGWWAGRSAFEIVVGAILTRSTAWTSVERAVAALRRAGALHPTALGALSARRVGPLFRTSGVDRVKAGRLHVFLQHLARHGGDLRRFLRRPLPELRAELLAIPGLGSETADAILLYAAGRPVFVVDTSTRRILSRHRVVPPDLGAAGLQARFMDNLPRDPALFHEYHALLVRVAKEYCRASVALCGTCPLRFDLRGRPPRLERSARSTWTPPSATLGG
jgi:endonuclease-3 related protein